MVRWSAACAGGNARCDRRHSIARRPTGSDARRRDTHTERRVSSAAAVATASVLDRPPPLVRPARLQAKPATHASRVTPKVVLRTYPMNALVGPRIHEIHR